MFLGICPFVPDCPFYWWIIAHNILLLFYFCSVVCDLSSFILDFMYLVLSFFFLIKLASGLSILLILSKNQLLVSLICFFGYETIGFCSCCISHVCFISSKRLTVLFFVCLCLGTSCFKNESERFSLWRWRIFPRVYYANKMSLYYEPHFAHFTYWRHRPNLWGQGRNSGCPVRPQRFLVAREGSSGHIASW